MAHIEQLLSTNGDGTGTADGAGDGSSVAIELSYQPAAVSNVRLLVLAIEDAGINIETFGGLAALTNGIDLECRLRATPFTISYAILAGAKTNLEFFNRVADVRVAPDLGGTDDVIRVVFDFARLRDDSFRMTTADELVLRINDNLTGLTTFTGRVYAEEH